MSSLWTPSGEHFPEKEDPPTPPSPPSPPPDAEAQAEFDAMRQQLADTPAEVVMANHCYGIFELATIYLSHTPPMLFEARLAIDGLGALLDGVKGRLGEAEPSLLEALSQLRLAFVQLEGAERAAAESPPLRRRVVGDRQPAGLVAAPVPGRHGEAHLSPEIDQTGPVSDGGCVKFERHPVGVGDGAPAPAGVEGGDPPERHQ